LCVFCPFVVLQCPAATPQKYPNIKCNKSPSYSSKGFSQEQADR
jgi:hypothetical protein